MLGAEQVRARLGENDKTIDITEKKVLRLL